MYLGSDLAFIQGSALNQENMVLFNLILNGMCAVIGQCFAGGNSTVSLTPHTDLKHFAFSSARDIVVGIFSVYADRSRSLFCFGLLLLVFLFC